MAIVSNSRKYSGNFCCFGVRIFIHIFIFGNFWFGDRTALALFISALCSAGGKKYRQRGKPVGHVRLVVFADNNNSNNLLYILVIYGKSKK